MSELITQLLTAQRYLVALLFIIIAIIWYRLKRAGIESLFKSTTAINLTLLLGLPFIISLLPNIPSQISNMIEVSGVFILALILFIFSLRDFHTIDTTRKKQLMELLEKPKHPVALEFARKIVEPEIKLLKKERKNLLQYEKDIQEKIRKREQELDTKIKGQSAKEGKFNLSKIEIEEESKILKEQKKLLEKEKKELENLKDQSEDAKEEIQVEKSRFEKQREKDKKFRKKLHEEKLHLDLERRKIESGRETYARKEKIIEQIDKRNEILNKKLQEIKEKEQEHEKKLKALEEREELLHDEKDEFAVARRKFEADKEKYEGELEKFRRKREELLIQENTLQEEKEALEKLTKSLSAKEKHLEEELGNLLKKQREMIEK